MPCWKIYACISKFNLALLLFALLLMTNFVSIAWTETDVPACPAGSQMDHWATSGKPYIHYECKSTTRQNGTEICVQPDGAHWNKAVMLPCGSRASSMVVYTGSLKCPIADQVYRWDAATHSLSKKISCIPDGWKAAPITLNRCPAGTEHIATALFSDETCYNPSSFHTSQELLTHEINGFTLDMTVQQVAGKAQRQLRPLGRGDYELDLNGQKYDFGFTILGRLYRIDYQQSLGYFTPDESYAATLTKRMTDKYGPPQTNQLPTGPINWEFLEPYRETGGPIFYRTAISLGGWLTGGWGQPIVLNMKLIDFRIMRRDLVKANSTPRSEAERKTEF